MRHSSAVVSNADTVPATSSRSEKTASAAAAPLTRARTRQTASAIVIPAKAGIQRRQGFVRQALLGWTAPCGIGMCQAVELSQRSQRSRPNDDYQDRVGYVQTC